MLELLEYEVITANATESLLKGTLGFLRFSMKSDSGVEWSMAAGSYQNNALTNPNQVTEKAGERRIWDASIINREF